MKVDRRFNVDEIMSASWDQLLARDLASELEYFSTDKRCLVPELRRFFAIKGYRDLLVKLRAACAGKTSLDALKSVAVEMRRYALERPALWAAASRTPAIDCADYQLQFSRVWPSADSEIGLDIQLIRIEARSNLPA
jgi:hypothetical protein